MKLSVLRYLGGKVAVGAIVSVIGASAVGTIKFAVDLLYHHTMSDSLKEGLLFFIIIYAIIWISGSVATVYALRKKAKEVGITLNYLSKLPNPERKDFEAQHGF